ncbi:MAG: DUF86 domain-containing protein [Thermoplasmata archaeon]|nr:DUF86 domain-containing protein [Thermoplasmata archaeon]
MDVDRAKRYIDKMDLINERINDIREWLSGVSIKEFMEDKKLRLASYKAFQEIVESSMDIVAMIIRDLSLIVKDDYTNLSILKERKILSKHVTDALKEGNGLRNRLIHRYNNLKEDIVFTSMKDLLKYFEEFVNEVEKWLKKNI